MKVRLPVVMTHRLRSLDYFWLGGGRPDIKMRVSTREFLAAFKPSVWDITKEGEEANKNVKPEED